MQPTAAVLSVGSQASWPILRHLGKAGVEAQGSGNKWLNSPTYTYSEVKLSVVTYLTNSIVDEILQELYHSHKSLVNILSPDGLRPSLCPVPSCLPRPLSSRVRGVSRFLEMLY